MRRSASLRALAILFCCLASPAGAAGTRAPVTPAAPAFGHAAIVQRDGEPTLVLDGKPVFFWGAAFFYERLPATQWRSSMLELKRLGVTTLDLYVPWNWHEVADGEFDFDGHTNPRRNLREVLGLGRELGFTFIVRPGPVIRNEWRNGGYPAWLLTRPEYGMPLHDVLEGRYPATATLQNAHSDDAAAEWMRNGTHLRYAARWLHRALAEFRPVADRVLAVQLDDDQGAYIDNQTYPAPHLQRYLRWLESQVREVVGPTTPTFINTYEMRVPASSPVWTMGNWYQSDAYAIGEHDRLALDLATAMLRTNRHGPLAVSEFQAGWLAQPEDPQPRPADPTNTTLALYELLGWGVHGIVDFPMQDTLAPFGWEAPFSNALYAWDAALRFPLKARVSSPNGSREALPGQQGSRYAATWQFGETTRLFGGLLAEARRVTDIAIAYPASSYPGDPAAGMTALSRFRDALRACTERGTPCDVVDLRNPGALRRLHDFSAILVVDTPTMRSHRALLLEYRRSGGQIVTRIPAEALPGNVLTGPDATFLVAVNWTTQPRHAPAGHHRFGTMMLNVPPFTTPARSARLVALDVRLARLDARYAPNVRLSTSCDLGADDVGVYADARAAPCEVTVRGARPIAAPVSLGRHVRIRFDGTLASHSHVFSPDGYQAVVPNRDSVAQLSPTDRIALAGIHQATAVPSETYRADPFGDGEEAVVMQNPVARAVIVPDGGARLPIFELMPDSSDPAVPYRPTADNAFDATGGLRDDVLVQLPPSPTDRIARYTHSYPAGTFNRSYVVSEAHDGSAHLVADVPDAAPSGARFERAVTLMPGTARLVVDERVRFAAGPGCEQQRGIVLSALSTAPDAKGVPQRQLVIAGLPVTTAGTLSAPTGVALVERSGNDRFVVAISWRPGDVESASWTPQRSNGTLRLVLAPGWRRVTYALTRAKTAAEADAFVEAERAWVAANPARISEDGEVAKRYTQSPQKRPSVSSCGFESHLPQ